MISAIVTFSNERQAHLMAQMNKVQAAQTTHITRTDSCLRK